VLETATHPVRTLVLGGSGHLGAALVRAALARGDEVTAAGRQKAPASLEGLGVRLVCGDDREPGAIASWVAGHDLVLDAAAPYPVRAFTGGGKALEHARRRTAELLAAVRAAGCPLGCVGSFVTCVEPDGGTAGWGARAGRLLHPYFAVKSAIEELLLDAAVDGARIALVNPVTCLGPWDSRPGNEALLPRLLRGELPMVARDPIGVVDVRDAAAALLAALERERFGRRHLLVGRRVEAAGLARLACELTGARPPALQVPAAWTIAPAWWLEAVLAPWGRDSPSPALIPLLVAAQASLPERGDETALGIEPRPLEETLRDAVRWYRRVGALPAS